MDIKEFKEPRTHVIIKDFLTEDEQEKIWEEIKENESKFKVGLYKKDGKEQSIHKDIKNNLQYNVTEIHPDIIKSDIRSMFYFKIFRDPDMIEIFKTAKSPIYQLLSHTIKDTTKVSAYTRGDFYDWHIDGAEHGLLVVLYMICKEPQKFTGGNIILKWDGIEKSIPFKNNTILIFVRNTPHKVSEIKLESNDFYDRRFTIQCWSDFGI